MTFRRRTSALAALSSGFASLGCGAPLDIPMGPDPRELAAVYDEPTGELTTDSLEDTIEEYLRLLKQIEELGRMEFVVSTLEDVGDVIAETARADQDSPVSLSGVAEVDTECEGFSESDPRGLLSFKTTFRDSYLEPVIWGEFSACRISSTPVPFELNSTLNIYLGGRVPLSDLVYESLLFQLVGEASNSDDSLSLSLDFRLKGVGLEVRVPATDGDVIFTVQDRLNRAAVRTSTGSFCCRFDRRSCVLVEEPVCDEITEGDEELTW